MFNNSLFQQIFDTFYIQHKLHGDTVLDKIGIFLISCNLQSYEQADT